MTQTAPDAVHEPTPPGPPGPDLSGPEFRFERFFLPGPTAIRPEVLEAMRQPVVGHRGEAMKQLMRSVRRGLGALFGTERPVFVSTSSATGVMEAAIVNLCRKRVLCLVCGAFSGRFRTIAETTGRPAEALEVDWGEPNLPERLAARLAEDPDRYDLVTAVHSETSTAVLNPIPALAEVVRAFDDVLIAVDGVSSVAGTPVRFDEWGLDYMLTGSQKAMALPPGLSFAVASERAMARARQVSGRSRYFDLLEFERRIENDQTPNTPAIHLIYALRRQLERVAEEGLEARFARHERMARRTHEWIAGTAERTGRPFRVLAPEGYRSPTVTALRLPDGIAGTELTARLRDRGWAVATGYGKLSEETVRIGHMGDHTPEELEGLLGALDEVLGEMLESTP